MRLLYTTCGNYLPKTKADTSNFKKNISKCVHCIPFAETIYPKPKLRNNKSWYFEFSSTCEKQTISGNWNNFKFFYIRELHIYELLKLMAQFIRRQHPYFLFNEIITDQEILGAFSNIKHRENDEPQQELNWKIGFVRYLIIFKPKTKSSLSTYWIVKLVSTKFSSASYTGSWHLW